MTTLSLSNSDIDLLHHKGFLCINDHDVLSNYDDRKFIKLGEQLGAPVSIQSSSALTTVRNMPGSSFSTLTHSKVHFHNDSIFLEKIPRYVVWMCDSPPDSGGQTLLISGKEIFKQLDISIQSYLKETKFYIEASGISYARSLVEYHPLSGVPVLVFLDERISSKISISGPDKYSEHVIQYLQTTINNTEFLYVHEWKRYDILIIDNYSVMHGRSCFEGDRCLKRLLIE